MKSTKSFLMSLRLTVWVAFKATKGALKVKGKGIIVTLMCMQAEACIHIKVIIIRTKFEQ